MSFSGIFQNGMVVFDTPPPLPEGARVEVTLPNAPNHGSSNGGVSLEELDDVLNELSALAPPAKSLPANFSRGDIYADHD